jgi:broad-specificity NMP kinase
VYSIVLSCVLYVIALVIQRDVDTASSLIVDRDALVKYIDREFFSFCSNHPVVASQCNHGVGTCIYVFITNCHPHHLIPSQIIRSSQKT